MLGTGEIFAFVQESVGGEVGGADQFSARIHGGTGEQVGACAKMGVRKNKSSSSRGLSFHHLGIPPSQYNKERE